MKITDVSGSIIWQADYEPFGKAVFRKANQIINHFRLPGQYHDTETGLHYNMNRYYWPAGGRYITPDPIGLLGGKEYLNYLYVYVQNNPVNLADPFGLFSDHSGFDEGEEFDWNKEDRGWTSPWNPVNTWRHFRHLSDIKLDIERAIKYCDKNDFERYMHQAQDYYAHYLKGYRWYNGGHLIHGRAPDKDPKAMEAANNYTKGMLDKWRRSCKCIE